MNITKVENPIFSKDDNTQIDCIITCDKGIFSFTARADDVMPYGACLFSDLMIGNYGPIAPYVGD